MQTEEKKLVADCIAGNLNAKRNLYDLYAGKLFTICLRYTKNHTDAEDVLQDAFLKILENIKQFRLEGSLEGWMKRIVVNTAIKQYHENSYKHLFVVNIETVEDDLQDAIQDDEQLPDYSEDELHEMIHSLAPGYRMVFSLYAIEEYSHKEIAQLLEISEGTSKSQLARARVVLQNMIREKQKKTKYA